MVPVSEGDREKRFRILYEETSSAILGYALRRAESAEDAAEVVAETFMTAWRRLDQVPLGPHARLWLYGVARRLLANYRRGSRRRSRLADRLRGEVPWTTDAGETDPSWELEAVRGALDQLRSEDREVITLAAWERLSHQELGQVLGCSANAAKIRLHRARRRLVASLAVDGAVKREEATGHAEGGWVHARPASEEDW